MPLPEEIERDLAVIDRALSGAPVDPADADLAELALLTAAARPRLGTEAAARLDGRIAGLAPSPRTPARARRRPGFLRPAYGAGLAVLVILVVAAIVVLPSGGGSTSGVAHSSAGASSSGASRSPGLGLRSLAPTAAASSSGSSSGALSPAPVPQSNGRRTVQSSQLDLTAPGARIGTVAQELFDVVGSEQGIVRHSSVSTGTGGFASFTLSIPTANLPAALARLAALRYATLSSSTEASTDVNGQYLSDQSALSSEQALRRSLLKQLAGASSTTHVHGLHAKLAAVEAEIARRQSALGTLQNRISYTAVSVQISPGSDVPGGSDGGGFTVSKAAHDALDVLKVIAGVLLIALAVLVPLALAVGAVLWGRRGWRRRDRERALDAT